MTSNTDGAALGCPGILACGESSLKIHKLIFFVVLLKGFLMVMHFRQSWHGL